MYSNTSTVPGHHFELNGVMHSCSFVIDTMTVVFSNNVYKRITIN